jgi:hypothetical protein
MPSVSLSPPPKLQFFGTDGNPLVGGKVYTYAAGTTTPLATYVDSAGVTVNTNPIILDTRGEANIWLTSAAYKFVLRTSTDTLIWTVDNITSLESVKAYITALLDAFKADLANTTDVAKGDALVGFRQSNTAGNLIGAVASTVHQKLQEVISVKDFGAVGSNTSLPLSGVTSFNGQNTTGWTLGQWQGIYPFVTALTQTLDFCGIQAAMNAASTSEYQRAAVYIPPGYYVITTSLQVPSWITLYGAANNGTVINNQTVTLAAPQCVNKDATAFQGVVVKNIVFSGGTYAFLITASTGMQSCLFENVVMQLQTATNLSADTAQVNTFINTIFSYAEYGFSGNVATANANNFIACSFLNIARTCVYLHAGSEVNNFTNCRFEAGGNAGYTTIDVVNPRSLNFNGCYFESTGGVLLTETSSTNSTSFDNCHFTYGAGSTPYSFNSDGIVHFGTNNWTVGGVANSPVQINGMNNTSLGNPTTYFAYAPQHKKIVSKWVPLTSTLTQDLVVFSRSATGATSDVQTLTGVLTINFTTLEAGGFPGSFSRLYQVNVRGYGAAVMVGGVTQISAIDNAYGSSTLVVSVASGATSSNLVITCVLTGLTPSTELASVLQWSFEYTQGSTVAASAISPKLSV